MLKKLFISFEHFNRLENQYSGKIVVEHVRINYFAIHVAILPFLRSKRGRVGVKHCTERLIARYANDATIFRLVKPVAIRATC